MGWAEVLPAAVLVLIPILAAGLVAARLTFRKSWTARRWVFWPSAACLGIYAIALLYGWLIESRWLQTTYTQIPTSRPVLGHRRFRIVHLSDLHLRSFGGLERRVLDAVRRADPHLILLTGDYLDRRGAVDELKAFLRELRAPYGVFAVIGNWDRNFPVRECFADTGVRLLEDEACTIRDELQIIGLDIRPNRRASELASGDGYRILLHHKPEAVDELAGARVDLMLCGHTHGGQVSLPFFGAVVPKRFERGLCRAYDTPVYVNRGIGTTGLPVRILSRPEVAVIELVSP